MNIIEIDYKGVDQPVWVERFRDFCIKILEFRSIDGWEVSILLCDDTFIRDLNRDYRGKDSATDVLSFSQDDGILGGIRQAGDIVISLDTLAKNSEEYSVDKEEELKRLLIHGILHLEGLDHRGNSPDEEMLTVQEELINKYKREKIF